MTRCCAKKPTSPLQLKPQAEYDRPLAQMIRTGACILLAKRPNSVLFRSDPSDAARRGAHHPDVQQRRGGPTNNWIAPLAEAHISGCTTVASRAAVVSLGAASCSMAADHSMSKIGVEITDSPYVVCNDDIMTRAGERVLEALGADGEFVPRLHWPALLGLGEVDVSWPCADGNMGTSHFPPRIDLVLGTVWVTAATLLGKKCSSAAHRLGHGPPRGVDGRTHADSAVYISPEGRQYHIAAAFLRAARRTWR